MLNLAPNIVTCLHPILGKWKDGFWREKDREREELNAGKKSYQDRDIFADDCRILEVNEDLMTREQKDGFWREREGMRC